MKQLKDSSFGKSYLELLRALVTNPDYICDSRLGSMREIINYSYKCSLDNDWAAFHRRFTHWNHDYAEQFFQWMMAGSTDMEQLAKINPSVRRFMPGSEIPASFSTAYGPRLLKQFDSNIAEFAKPNSRRVVFHILEPGDDFLRFIDTKLEYPCCISLTFFKREAAWNTTCIDVVANFRSSNAYITMIYDAYNISGFAKHFARVFSERYDTEVQLGSLNFQLASAHLYETNLEAAKNLIQ